MPIYLMTLQKKPSIFLFSSELTIFSGKSVNPPLTLIQLCDSHLRSPAVSYDELTSSINLLTNVGTRTEAFHKWLTFCLQECNEFIDYCTIRGCDRSRLTSSNENVDIETLSKWGVIHSMTAMVFRKFIHLFWLILAIS